MNDALRGDLREFIDVCRKHDEVLDIDGVDWNVEVGALTEAIAESMPGPPMLLFDHVKGHLPGYRILTQSMASHRRVALALGLDPDLPKLDLIRMATAKMQAAQLLPPVEVSDGPVLENVFDGSDIDMEKFPATVFAPLNGGRYIGTGDTVINKDPDSGYVNAGTYRMQLHDRDTLGLWMSPGQHGRQICERYWRDGRSCPVVASFGNDPAVFITSRTQLDWGVSELDFVGGLREEPLRVIPGPITGLPIPASAEIAIEGEIPPPDVESREEGPFGEWPGYYSGGSRGVEGRPQPLVHVRGLYHRNDPILNDETPMWPGLPQFGLPILAGLLWDQLNKSGVPNVVGVNIEDISYFVVIAIKQTYPGHAKQTGMAALGCGAAARHGRYVVIVDDDIDPTNMKEVLWAMETRVDPASDIDIIDGTWSTPLDPRMPADKRASSDFTNSRAIIYAVRPYHWRHEYPEVTRVPAHIKQAVIEKFRHAVPFPKS